MLLNEVIGFDGPLRDMLNPTSDKFDLVVIVLFLYDSNILNFPDGSMQQIGHRHNPPLPPIHNHQHQLKHRIDPIKHQALIPNQPNPINHRTRHLHLRQANPRPDIPNEQFRTLLFGGQDEDVFAHVKAGNLGRVGVGGWARGQQLLKGRLGGVLDDEVRAQGVD